MGWNHEARFDMTISRLRGAPSPESELAEGDVDKGADQGTARRPGNGSLWYWFIVLAGASFSSLSVWANAGEEPILLTLFVAWFLAAAVAIGLWRLLIRVGRDPEGSSYAVCLFVLVIANAGGLVGRYHRLDRLGLFLLAVAVAVIAYRLRRIASFNHLMTWFAIFLVAYPIANIIGRVGFMSSPERNVDVNTNLTVQSMHERPDILVVFFDAYGSAEVLDTFYGFDNSAQLQELQDRGFEAPTEISANYARTQLAIPAFLQMDYVAGETEISDADVSELLRVLAGDNRLAAALRDQGYRQVHVESGWLGSRCGPTVDICVGARWPDETLFDVVYRSLLTDIPGFEIGRSFTDGATRAADWLADDLRPYLEDSQPDFIFAHVLLPHPPLFLDKECSADWDGGVSGFAIGQRRADDQQIQQARREYVEQVQCANRVMIQTADVLGEDDVALFVGDHGPDLQGQLFMPSSEWTDDQLRERFGTFMAAKVPGCEMGGIESVVNIGRRMMSCLTGDSFPDLPTRTYDLARSPSTQMITEIEMPTS